LESRISANLTSLEIQRARASQQDCAYRFARQIGFPQITDLNSGMLEETEETGGIGAKDNDVARQ